MNLTNGSSIEMNLVSRFVHLLVSMVVGLGLTLPVGSATSVITDETVSEPVATGKLLLGMNLSPLNYSDREWVFVDVFKQSRAWISQDAEDGGPWNNRMEIDLNEEMDPAIPLLRIRRIGV